MPSLGWRADKQRGKINVLSPEGRKESGQAKRADVHYSRFLGVDWFPSLCLLALDILSPLSLGTSGQV